MQRSVYWPSDWLTNRQTDRLTVNFWWISALHNLSVIYHHHYFFQIFSDVHNGFAGLTSQVIEDLTDEYSSKSIITYGLLPGFFPGNTDTKSAQRVLNMALSYRHISENSSIFTPLSMARQGWFHTGSPAVLPYLNYKVGELNGKHVGVIFIHLWNEK